MLTLVSRRAWRALAVSVALIAIGATSGPVAAEAAVTHQHQASVLAVQGVSFRHVLAVQFGEPAITSPRPRPGTTLHQGGGNLLYHGGPVQEDPEVYVLFWGSWWLSTCPAQRGHGGADEAYLYRLYSGLGSASDYLSPITSQYYGPAGSYPVFPTVAGRAFIAWNADCANPPSVSTGAQLASEAMSYARYLASEGYPVDGNTQIVVVSPSGINAGGGFGAIYCAYHNWARYSPGKLISWTNLPYIPDAGWKCGVNRLRNRNDGWSIVAGHEYAESITDPLIGFKGAWYDKWGSEIGDKCIWTKMFVLRMSTGSFAMQSEWDNMVSRCQDRVVHPSGPS